jgi:hypothetical protein
MKGIRCLLMVLAAAWALAAAPGEKGPRPQCDEKGQLMRPVDYREWMFLSAGYGMNYSPGPDSQEMFTNVFVQRWAYEQFVKSGKWPEQSMFVIDERDAGSRSSINQKGHYQTDLMGLAVEVRTRPTIPTSGCTTASTPKAEPPEPCRTATPATPATTRTRRWSIHSCSSIRL